MRLRCFGQSEHARVLLARAKEWTFSSPGLSCVCDPFCTYSSQRWELKQRRFWATHVNQKLGLVPFNFPRHDRICIATCLYTHRDDLPENLGKTTAQEWKKSTSGWRARSKMSLLKLEYRRFSWRVHNYIRIFFFFIQGIRIRRHLHTQELKRAPDTYQ